LTLSQVIDTARAADTLAVHSLQGGGTDVP